MPKAFLKKTLSRRQKTFLKKLASLPRVAVWWAFRPIMLHRYRRRDKLRINLGCGETFLPGFVHVDLLPTRITELVLNLSRFDFFQNQVSVLFSNAFFEHLFRNDRVTHLQGAKKSLMDDGFACYLGLPNFEKIARAYLDGASGFLGPKFDLLHVYWYTHGAPEIVLPDYYLPQLHKSLFDRQELSALLTEAGFTSFQIFEYCDPETRSDIPLLLGFFAKKNPTSAADLKSECTRFLAEFPALVRADSLQFLTA